MIAPSTVESLTPDELARLREPLQTLYHELDAAVARLGPLCQASGRCCRFEEYDHTLFVSSGEVALLMADAPEPSRPLDHGATCPWQDARGLCTARDARPLGCRVYFCDPNYEEQGAVLSEQFLARLKRIVDRLGLRWSYAPLHHHLQNARATGRFQFAKPLPPRTP